MDEFAEIIEETYAALSGKSKEEILSKEELIIQYVDCLENVTKRQLEVIETTKELLDAKDKTINLQKEVITGKEEIITLLQIENKQLRTLLRKNGISIPFN